MYYFYMGSELLPVAPKKFSLKIKNQNKTLTLINEGEINLLKDAGLTELEFEVLIPAVQYSFAEYDGGFKPPSHFKTVFQKLKTSKESFQFIITRKMPNGIMLFDTNMTVSMEDYVITEEADDGFDLRVSIKLKQYRDFGTKIVKVVDNSASVNSNRGTKNSPASKLPTTHNVVKGDCLWNIAQYYYGDGNKYPKIYQANKTLIDTRNNKYGQPKYTIYPNQALTIPAL